VVYSSAVSEVSEGRVVGMVYGGELGCAVGGLEGRLGMDGVKVTCYFPSPSLLPLLLWRLHIVHCVIEMVCTAKM